MGGSSTRSGQSFRACRASIPRVTPAACASGERARMVERSAPGGATASGRLRSAGAASRSTVAQNAGGSMKTMDFTRHHPISVFLR
ncbi:MAG TPA: hypothetical protein VGQ17_10570 [Gemmatimonadales bacterium]|nr:hypothetical protein [Gemmatimonadales bacterium]